MKPGRQWPLPEDADKASDHDTVRQARLLVAGLTLQKIADQLGNVRTLLPWLINALGLPGWLVTTIAPLREGLAMFPQVILGKWLTGLSTRKRWWLVAAGIQAVGLTLVSLVFLLPGQSLMIAGILLAVTLFSLGRSLTSLTLKDLQANLLEKNIRGRVTSIATLLASPVLAGIAVVIALIGNGDSAGLISALIFLGAGCWVLAMLVMAPIRENREEYSRGSERAEHYSDLLKQPAFIHLVLVRTLLFFPVLLLPLYPFIASGQSGSLWLLAAFMVTEALGAGLVAPLWGKLADHSTRLCLMAAGIVTSLPPLVASIWLFAEARILEPVHWLALFVVSAIGHTGIRTGRKVHAMNLADGSDRTRVVALSNTCVGGLLVVASVINLSLFRDMEMLLLFVFAVTGLAGALFSLFIKQRL